MFFNTTHLNQNLKKIAGATFLALAFVPALYNPWADLPYEPIKIQTICFIAVLLLVFGVAILILSHGTFNYHKITRLDWVVVLFGTVLILSSLFSANPGLSFWGSEERGMGLWFYFHLFLIYLSCRLYLEKRVLQIFFKICVVVAGLISFYALIQSLGFDILGLQDFFLLYGRTGPRRVFSTLGHPNFLGAYLALILPWILAWYRQASSAKPRLLLAGIFVVQSLALILTYSRGAWLGAVMGLLIYFSMQKTKKMHLMYFSIILMIIFLSFPNLWSRLSTSFEWRSGSSLVRLNEWRASFELISKRPLLGHGLETYDIFSGGSRPYEVDRAPMDRLHNFWLDALWSNGFIGLLAVLAIIIEVIKRLRKLGRENNKLTAPLAASFGAYLVMNQFSFDFSISALFVAILLGCVVDNFKQES
jgi:putative inorganic carbon (HCO3(-)) transporter